MSRLAESIEAWRPLMTPEQLSAARAELAAAQMSIVEDRELGHADA